MGQSDLQLFNGFQKYSDTVLGPKISAWSQETEVQICGLIDKQLAASYVISDALIEAIEDFRMMNYEVPEGISESDYRLGKLGEILNMLDKSVTITDKIATMHHRASAGGKAAYAGLLARSAHVAALTSAVAPQIEQARERKVYASGQRRINTKPADPIDV